MAEEIRRRFEPGQIFTFQEMYEGSGPRFRSAYPNNTTIEATLSNVLQRRRDDGFLEFVGRGEYRCLGPRAKVADRSSVAELGMLLSDLIDRIADETSIDADDYLDIAVSAEPAEALRQLLLSRRTSPTFQSLYRALRLDLTMEQLVGDFAPYFDSQVVEAAKGRLEYYRKE